MFLEIQDLTVQSDQLPSQIERALKDAQSVPGLEFLSFVVEFFFHQVLAWLKTNQTKKRVYVKDWPDYLARPAPERIKNDDSVLFLPSHELRVRRYDPMSLWDPSAFPQVCLMLFINGGFLVFLALLTHFCMLAWHCQHSPPLSSLSMALRLFIFYNTLSLHSCLLVLRSGLVFTGFWMHILCSLVIYKPK